MAVLLVPLLRLPSQTLSNKSFGIIPKSAPGKWRLITDLSSSTGLAREQSLQFQKL